MESLEYLGCGQPAAHEARWCISSARREPSRTLNAAVMVLQESAPESQHVTALCHSLSQLSEDIMAIGPAPLLPPEAAFYRA